MIFFFSILVCAAFVAANFVLVGSSLVSGPAGLVLHAVTLIGVAVSGVIVGHSIHTPK